MPTLADKFLLRDNPRRVCLVPPGSDEADDKTIAIIVAVHRVTPTTIVLGNGHEEDERDKVCLTTFDWRTGKPTDGGLLKQLVIPPSELARLEECDVQGAYG